MAPSEILSNLFLGDMQDALALQGQIEISIICVLESWTMEWLRVWQPLLGTAPNGQVAKYALDFVADCIDSILKSGRKVLVHCGAGIERSPLAVAWYLVKFQKLDLDEAYKMIKAKRPQVMDRRAWIAA